jgi:hypothetical protein
MKNAFLIGRRIYLRPLEEEDLDGDYLKWVTERKKRSPSILTDICSFEWLRQG